MAAKKISVDSKVVQALHQEMKDTIKKKALEKDWNETEKEDFISAFLKLYEETVEVALRENTIVNHEEGTTISCDTTKQEVETLDKEWAKDVNERCAESEDLLTCTVKKRKYYPQKTKEHLHKKHATELINLEKIRDQITNEENDEGTYCRAGLDMTECESSWSRLNQACECLTEFSKAFIETKEKFEKVNTVTKMKLKMKDDCKIFATPSKESLDDTIPESNNTLSTRWCQNESQKLKGCVRKSSPHIT